MKEKKESVKIDWKKLLDKKYWKIYVIVLVALALVTTLVVWLCLRAPKDETERGEDGKITLHHVSISGGDTPAEQNAASELEKYLCQKGVTVGEGGFPITVSIDPTLDDDSFRVTATVGEGKDEGMTIVGGNGRGVLYGVYQFLEKYADARFFTPELEICTKGDVTIPDGVLLDIDPLFEMRHTDWYNWVSDDTKYEWAVKNGVNIMNGWKRSWDESFGGSLTYAPNLFVHTISRLIQPDVSGSITAVSPNPCLSDEATFQTVLANVRKVLAENPDTKIVSISQNDNPNYCKCERCAATDAEEGSPAGTLLRFVNRIAADLEPDYPNLTIDTLAYQYTRKAPAITKPRDNVCIRLCSIECHFNHPLTTESCAVCSKFREDIVAWSKISDNIYIWDYTTNYAHYLTTFPNFHVLRENMQFFANHNVKGVYEQGNGNSLSGEFGELRAYLIAKLLMNPYMSEEEYNRHTEEFLAAYYGAGWENIRTYINTFTSFANTPSVGMGIYSNPFTVLSRDDLLQQENTLNSLWDAAEAAAGDRLEYVKRSRWQLRYLLLYVHPDANVAQQLINEAADLNVAWREGNWHVTDTSDLSLPPDQWSYIK